MNHFPHLLLSLAIWSRLSLVSWSPGKVPEESWKFLKSGEVLRLLRWMNPDW